MVDNIIIGLAKTAFEVPFAIKNSTKKLFNNIKNIGNKINTTTIYEKSSSDYGTKINILILDNGNIILNDDFLLKDHFQIVNGKTFKIINNILIKNHQGLRDITSVIAFKKNEIAFCDDNFKIGYILFDEKYKAEKMFFKQYLTKDGFLGNASLRLLKNKKIVYMGKSSDDNNEAKIGLTRIYILSCDRKNDDFIMESKINAFDTYFYEIKSKNVYLINNIEDFVCFFNSKNLKPVKKIKFNFSKNMKLINDEYFIQGHNEDDKGIIYLYKLDNCELIKTVQSNELYNIFAFDKNLFFICEIQQFQYFDHIEFNYIINMWEFNEKEKDIKRLGFLNFENNNRFYEFKKFKSENDMYFIKYQKSFKLIKINNK